MSSSRMKFSRQTGRRREFVSASVNAGIDAASRTQSRGAKKSGGEPNDKGKSVTQGGRKRNVRIPGEKDMNGICKKDFKREGSKAPCRPETGGGP